jgi:excisionase family DNA binding protein
MRTKNLSTPHRQEYLAEVSSLAPTPALLHDIPTVARIMSTTTWAVRQLCRAGRLKFVRVGHRFLVSTQAIQAYISTNETYHNGSGA